MKKIDVFYIDSKGHDHYLWSTNRYNKCIDAIFAAIYILGEGSKGPINYHAIESQKVGEAIIYSGIYARFSKFVNY